MGSEGRFGIALEITVRLLSKPEAYKTVLAAYKSLEAAGEAVSQVVAAGMLPGAMEIMDHLAIEAAEAAVHAGYPLEAGALLIVELEGEQAEVQADFVFLEKIIEASGPFEVRVAQDEADRMRIWKGRKSAFFGGGALEPGLHRPGRRGAKVAPGRSSGGHRAPQHQVWDPGGQRLPRRRRQSTPSDPF